MINTNKYEGHTPAPWETNSDDSQGVWQEHDESIPRHIAMVHSDQNWEDMSETEFMRMMADKELITDAPLLLAEVKRLREIEGEWMLMWDTLEELNLVADVRKNMTEHGFTFETDEEMIE